MTDRSHIGDDTAVIAGGGTAGHVVPGLAIAEALVDGGWPRDRIHFIGSARGVETEMVPAAGFALTTLPGRGINERRLSLANVRNVFDLLRGIARGAATVVRRRPSVVVSLGGYAALPAGIGAVVRRVPLVVAEQNAVPSSTNRFLGRFAAAAAVPFEGVDLPRATVTGNPVRAEVLRAVESGNRRGWPDDRLCVVVFGGSLGSRRINEAVWSSIEVLAARADLFVYHVVGHRDWPDRPEVLTDSASYQAVEYDDDLATALVSADLVVSRAGGSTVAELAVVGVGAILVPLPIAIHDHQRHNAKALVEAGAGVLVDDSDFDGERLVHEIEEAIDRGATDAGRAARTVGVPDAAARVAALVRSHARRTPSSLAVPDNSAPREGS